MNHPTDRIEHTTAFVIPVVKQREIAQWIHRVGSIRRACANAVPRNYTQWYNTYHIRVLSVIYGIWLSVNHFIVSPLQIYFSFQPVLHDWYNKGCGMCYPVCEMVHIKEPMLTIGKSSLCGGSGFPFSLSEWSLTICLTPYNRK